MEETSSAGVCGSQRLWHSSVWPLTPACVQQSNTGGALSHDMKALFMHLNLMKRGGVILLVMGLELPGHMTSPKV